MIPVGFTYLGTPAITRAGYNDFSLFSSGGLGIIIDWSPGAATIVGSRSSDYIYADKFGDSDRLAPTLFNGGSGFDIISYENAQSGVGVNLGAAVASPMSGGFLGEASGDTYLFIEGVVGSRFGDTLIGSAASGNAIHGNGGGDTIWEQLSTDLYGTARLDRYYGGDGDDTFFVNALSNQSATRNSLGNISDYRDVFVGGKFAPTSTGIGEDTSFNDTINFSKLGTATNVVLDLAWNFATYGSNHYRQLFVDGTATRDGAYADALDRVRSLAEFTEDKVFGIEHAVGSDTSDHLAGDHRDNRLDGGGGNDFLLGRSGSDVLFGGTGDDTIWGGTGTDWIDGGEGYDTLFIDAQSSTVDIYRYGVNTGYYVVVSADGGEIHTDIVRSIEAVQFADGGIFGFSQAEFIF